MATPRARQRRGQAGKRSGRTAPCYAAIDLGTNNCRLLVAQPQGERFRVVDSYSQIVRLGEGLAETGKLSDAAMDRTIVALKACHAKLKGTNLKRIRCVATQAARAASNGRSLVERIQSETGLSFKIISGHEEARLAVTGVLDLVAPKAERVLVIDIGGGSTELAWVDADDIRELGLKGFIEKRNSVPWASFPVGVVTIAEEFPEGNDPEWYERTVEYCASMFRKSKAGRRFYDSFKDGKGHLIGTSGTVTSLCGLHLGLETYVRSRVDGSWMQRTDATRIIDRLRETPFDKRGQLGCIDSGRADLILAGSAILDAVWRVWPSDSLRVADRGLREGLLLSMIHSKPKAKRRKKPASSSTESAEVSDNG